MYSSFDKNMNEFTYSIERISMITKEFLNKLNSNDKLYNLILEIYKSSQSINHEFTKLHYKIKLCKIPDINMPNVKIINMPVENIKTITEYTTFINNSYNNLKDFLDYTCKSFSEYSSLLKKELSTFKLLINNLNA